jgi:hypothetical protein
MCIPSRTALSGTMADARSRQCLAAAAPPCWTLGEAEVGEIVSLPPSIDGMKERNEVAATKLLDEFSRQARVGFERRH